ncbi:MAG: dihydrodipicolinate synthase family protein [Microvirga sp.]
MGDTLRFGVSPALVTPFGRDRKVDIEALAAHATDLLGRGCTSVTLFGTTGEGPSVPPSEREATATGLVRAGIAPEKLVEGVIACSVEEAAESTRAALRRGAKAVLLAPPFYFRPVPDEAVFAWFAEVLGSVGEGLRDVILYHIPSLTGVSLSIELIARLRTAFPAAITGVKDSAADAQASMRLIEAHGDLAILVGDETYLGRACAAGAAGSICGLANLVPEAVIAVAASGRDDPRIQALVEAINRHPMIPMVKALVAHLRREPAFATASPPLPTPAAATVREVLPYLEAFFTSEQSGSARLRER